VLRDHQDADRPAFDGDVLVEEGPMCSMPLATVGLDQIL
jgi:hypothetical protein